MLLRTHNAVLLMLLRAHNAGLLMLLRAYNAVLLMLFRAHNALKMIQTEIIQTRGKHNLGLCGSPLKSNNSNIYTIEI